MVCIKYFEQFSVINGFYPHHFLTFAKHLRNSKNVYWLFKPLILLLCTGNIIYLYCHFIMQWIFFLSKLLFGLNILILKCYTEIKYGVDIIHLETINMCLCIEKALLTMFLICNNSEPHYVNHTEECIKFSDQCPNR